MQSEDIYYISLVEPVEGLIERFDYLYKFIKWI